MAEYLQVSYQVSERKACCALGFARSSHRYKSTANRQGFLRIRFHDLRRTCITNWFAHGLSEYEVMIMAGHASFETTRKFYMAIRKDLLTFEKVKERACISR